MLWYVCLPVSFSLLEISPSQLPPYICFFVFRASDSIQLNTVCHSASRCSAHGQLGHSNFCAALLLGRPPAQLRHLVIPSLSLHSSSFCVATSSCLLHNCQNNFQERDSWWGRKLKKKTTWLNLMWIKLRTKTSPLRWTFVLKSCEKDFNQQWW